ncbi:uncharacterized protein LOC131199947 [Ahaetulla prasina]|uniref:uncharacterized protein LOC131199947 n=1 Tax=Ahaetulla prasina TaxID=499056 RepID=UPI00264A227E|nr:uncharacterized protein LOC131199947 [Ahaetulla prasina]
MEQCECPFGENSPPDKRTKAQAPSTKAVGSVGSQGVSTASSPGTPAARPSLAKQTCQYKQAETGRNDPEETSAATPPSSPQAPSPPQRPNSLIFAIPAHRLSMSSATPSPPLPQMASPLPPSVVHAASASRHTPLQPRTENVGEHQETPEKPPAASHHPNQACRAWKSRPGTAAFHASVSVHVFHASVSVAPIVLEGKTTLIVAARCSSARYRGHADKKPPPQPNLPRNGPPASAPIHHTAILRMLPRA